MNWVKIRSKLFGDDVTVPSGTVVKTNTDDKFDAEYVDDPNIGKWWYSSRLNAHFMPTEYIGGPKKLYRVDAVYRGPDGKLIERTFEIPFFEWVPSEKPVSGTHESKAQTVVVRLLSS